METLPNALPVPLTTNERAQLYGLWSELIESHDSWPIWNRYEISLRQLIDRWVEAIRSVVDRADAGMGGIEKADASERPVEEQWGDQLRRRIEGQRPEVRGQKSEVRSQR